MPYPTLGQTFITATDMMNFDEKLVDMQEHEVSLRERRKCGLRECLKRKDSAS